MKIYNPQDDKVKEVLVIGTYDEWQAIIHAINYACGQQPKQRKWKAVLKQLDTELGVF